MFVASGRVDEYTTIGVAFGTGAHEILACGDVERGSCCITDKQGAVAAAHLGGLRYWRGAFTSVSHSLRG